MQETVHHRICPICEACCGLEIKVMGPQVISVRGHEADVLSRGYIYPKGVAIKDLHEDPDRLRTPSSSAMASLKWPPGKRPIPKLSAACRR